MPKFYKGSWVHFVHFNQFSSRKPKIVSFSKEPLPPKVPRELSPQEKKHRERMLRLYTEYDEWPEEKKEKFFKNDK